MQVDLLSSRMLVARIVEACRRDRASTWEKIIQDLYRSGDLPEGVSPTVLRETRESSQRAIDSQWSIPLPEKS